MKKFQRVLVHSTPQSGVRYMWTDDKTKDRFYNVPMFGIPKVIFGETGINEPVADLHGEFSMTECAMAIPCKKDDIKKAIKYLKSDSFSDIINACMWSTYRIDWRMFKYFKDKFWENSCLPEE